MCYAKFITSGWAVSTKPRARRTLRVSPVRGWSCKWGLVLEEDRLYDWRMAILHSQWEKPESECVIVKKNTIETQ
jgi:hypothetical protein